MLPLLFAASALACSVPAPQGPSPTFAETVARYDAVFATEPLGAEEGKLFAVKVRAVYSGEAGGTVKVHQAANNCEPLLQEGNAYLLYVRKEKDGTFRAGSVTLLDQSLGAIRWLQAAKKGLPEPERDAQLKKEIEGYESRRDLCAKLGAFPEQEPAASEAKKKWVACHQEKGLCSFLDKQDGRSDCYARLKGI